MKTLHLRAALTLVLTDCGQELVAVVEGGSGFEEGDVFELDGDTPYLVLSVQKHLGMEIIVASETSVASSR